MNPQEFDLNKIRIASPCSVGWENMYGDERVRRCDSCELNIFNIAEMTAKEVETLIATREGRLCVRLYRRADGTVITKDCPVGWRAYQKRVGRFAGAALTAILGLFSVSFGQKEDKNDDVNASKIKIVRTDNHDKKSKLTGTVTDPQGAAIPGAKLSLMNEKGEKSSFATNDDGLYDISPISQGEYSLEIYFTCFKKLKVTHIKVGGGERLEMNLALKVLCETVGVLMNTDSSIIEIGSSSISNTITPRKIEKLPH